MLLDRTSKSLEPVARPPFLNRTPLPLHLIALVHVQGRYPCSCRVLVSLAERWCLCRQLILTPPLHNSPPPWLSPSPLSSRAVHSPADSHSHHRPSLTGSHWQHIRPSCSFGSLQTQQLWPAPQLFTTHHPDNTTSPPPPPLSPPIIHPPSPSSSSTPSSAVDRLEEKSWEFSRGFWWDIDGRVFLVGRPPISKPSVRRVSRKETKDVRRPARGLSVVSSSSHLAHFIVAASSLRHCTVDLWSRGVPCGVF